MQEYELSALKTRRYISACLSSKWLCFYSLSVYMQILQYMKDCEGFSTYQRHILTLKGKRQIHCHQKRFFCMLWTKSCFLLKLSFLGYTFTVLTKRVSLDQKREIHFWRDSTRQSGENVKNTEHDPTTYAFKENIDASCKHILIVSGNEQL